MHVFLKKVKSQVYSILLLDGKNKRKRYEKFLEGTWAGVVSLTLCRFVVYSTKRFVVCLSVQHFVLVFSVLLVLRLPRLGKRELILVLFVRLFGLCLFRFVSFLFFLGSGKGCGLIVALPGLFSYLFL